MTDRTCSRCGSPVVAGAHFCSRCGHDVSGEQSVLATAKMAPPPPRPSPPPQIQSEILEPLRRATAGDYDIAGELGRGGMATVFLAHDIALDRKVAIKVMTPSLVTGAGMVERFKREARTAASLSHPHIIPIYAVREIDKLLYFVMKFVEGRSLDTVIREQGPLPIPLVQAIMAQVGGALGYAHRRGIVHRDMKPANIMLDEEGWAVVTDFGIAKVADARGLTMTGVTIGTPSYMSPEQCASKEITGATDQYSLGIVAYELLTGKVPFDADSLMGIMWKHFNEPPPPVRDARPDCPEHIADAITRMLAKAPAARWPTMEDAVAAIGQPPMAPGDPIRQQMRALAMGGTAEDLRDRIHTPASPIPVTPDSPTMPSAPVPSMPTPPPTPAPTPVPTGRGTTGRPPSVADVPTVLTGDAPTVFTGDAPTRVTSEAATVVTPHATGPATAPRPSAQMAPPGPPVGAPHVFAETEPAGPRRRGLAVGLGLAAVAVISAGAVWFALSLGSSGGTEPGPETGTDTIVEAPAPPPAPVVSLTLNESAQSMAVGTTGELIAWLLDSTRNVPANRTISWRSTDPTVATVQAGPGVSGIIEALKAGTARIIASSEDGPADTAMVTVTAVRAAVASVTVQLQTAELAPGDTVNVSARPQDANGVALGGRGVQFESSAPNVVRVAGTRLFALAEGTANIVAVSEGVRSPPVRVTVSVPPVASVAIRGPTAGLEEGGGVRLGLTVLDARNKPVTSYQADWQSASPRVATVAGDGTVRAVSVGEAIITATVNGKRATYTLRVVPPPRVTVARLDVRPVSTLEVGKTSQAGAAALDANSRQLLDRKVNWSSSNTAVATVAQDGTITALAPGKTTITAESEGKRQFFELEVPAPEPTTVVEVRPPPVTPVTPAVTAAAIGLGAEVSCAALGDGSASCWGTGAPGRVTELNAQRIVTGNGHACALLGNGSVRCWGANASGQLGSGQSSREPVARPAAVATDQVFTSIVAGAAHTCGIARDGSAWCWGENGDGQLGNGRTQDQAAPVAVARGLTYRQLAAGERHTCGIATDGKAHCWGFGFSYALGTGATENQPEPYGVSSRALFKLIAAGKETTCAVTQEGGPVCWGKGFPSSPRAVTTEQQFTQLAVGDEFACGLTGSGAAWCWGRNNRGQLGDGSGRNQTSPVRVATDAVFTTIAAGNTHACGVTSAGPTLCWGDNAKGQVGAGATGPVPTPVPIEIRR